MRITLPQHNHGDLVVCPPPDAPPTVLEVGPDDWEDRHGRRSEEPLRLDPLESIMVEGPLARNEEFDWVSAYGWRPAAIGSVPVEVLLRVSVLPQEWQTALREAITVHRVQAGGTREDLRFVDFVDRRRPRRQRHGLLKLWSWRLLQPRCGRCRSGKCPCDGQLGWPWSGYRGGHRLECWCVCRRDTTVSWATLRGWVGSER